MFVSIKLEITIFPEFSKVKIWADNGELHYTKEQIGNGVAEIKDEVSAVSVEEFSQKIEAIDIPGWKKDYQPVGMIVLDGTSWTVTYETVDNKPIKREGDNAYPRNWKSFIRLLQSVVGDFETYED